MKAQQYVVNVPTSAVTIERLSAVGRVATKVITVPSASIIEVPRTLSRLQGLIEVIFQGETVLMFAEDLRERGKLVSDPAV